MSTPHAPRCRRMPKIAMIAVFSVLGVAWQVVGGVTVHAQGAAPLRPGPGASVGPSGQGSGGVSGGTAGPLGSGIGGAAAGAGDNSGGSGAATGPGPTNQNRFGGPTRTEPAPPPVVPPAADQSAPTAQLADPFSPTDPCADVVGGRVPAAARLGPRNRERLRAAERLLAPQFDPGSQDSGIRILAEYQEELEKARPNPTTAGSYLGVVSAQPLSPALVSRVNRLLCVSVPSRLSQQIVATANDVRTQTNRPSAPRAR